MKKTRLTCLAVAATMVLAANAQESKVIGLFDHATFYDGYLMDKNPDKDLEDGILRHSTSLYAVKMTEEQLESIGEELRMNVWVTACCDNYDRIGNINLAFVPKGNDSYTTDEVDRIELGRFITPFMDKNKNPDTVPYTYEVSYLSSIFRNKQLREQYDLWVELEIFGIPYAANEQIAGCAGRSDVFQGTLQFETSTPAQPLVDNHLLVPVVIKKPEYIGNNLNNYHNQATDTLGKTTKTYTLRLPEDVTDGQLVVITSNHGANENGEEYNRRWHYLYLDNQLVLSYIPGRTSCEPFREYNTQWNGIYGSYALSDATWQSFSNWCPGDVIDNRIINLGALEGGRHKLRISVPDAKFNGKQGDIPVSIFFQGTTEGHLEDHIILPEHRTEQAASIRLTDGTLQISSQEAIEGIEVHDTEGHLLHRVNGNKPLSLAHTPAGLYLVRIYLASGIVETHKVYNAK